MCKNEIISLLSALKTSGDIMSGPGALWFFITPILLWISSLAVGSMGSFVWFFSLILSIVNCCWRNSMFRYSRKRCSFQHFRSLLVFVCFHVYLWLCLWSFWYSSTISCIIFWDFSMFYKLFLSPQVKRWAIITYKHGIYELPHELRNVRVRILGN